MHGHGSTYAKYLSRYPKEVNKQLPIHPALTTAHQIHLHNSASQLPAFSTYHSAEDLAEHHVAPVQPAGLLGGDEELRAVGVLASVSHRHPAGAVVLQLEVLVSELLAVDTAA